MYTDCGEMVKKRLEIYVILNNTIHFLYRGADKSLPRPGRKQAAATEDFNFHTAYLRS
jgi:hypothetical protein